MGWALDDAVLAKRDVVLVWPLLLAFKLAVIGQMLPLTHLSFEPGEGNLLAAAPLEIRIPPLKVQLLFWRKLRLLEVLSPVLVDVDQVQIPPVEATPLVPRSLCLRGKVSRGHSLSHLVGLCLPSPWLLASSKVEICELVAAVDGANIVDLRWRWQPVPVLRASANRELRV